MSEGAHDELVRAARDVVTVKQAHSALVAERARLVFKAYVDGESLHELAKVTGLYRESIRKDIEAHQKRLEGDK